jgi:hypothetical protein
VGSLPYLLKKNKEPQCERTLTSVTGESLFLPSKSLSDLPHTLRDPHFSSTFGFEKFTHGSKPRACGAQETDRTVRRLFVD